MTIFSIDQSLCKNGTRLVGAFCCHGLLSLLEEDVDQLPSTADVTAHHQNGSNRACFRALAVVIFMAKIRGHGESSHVELLGAATSDGKKLSMGNTQILLKCPRVLID
ncbi:hypothetical protein D5086_018997 [Populus alba]|uniref:Uncharacterized protein n=2 Tax=Populus TaxID=3689 RepID=A0ACC4BFY5_POPAL|nr:hypothetical protein NC653_024248 [Populus alba x Populus x berolinensis]